MVEWGFTFSALTSQIRPLIAPDLPIPETDPNNTNRVGVINRHRWRIDPEIFDVTVNDFRRTVNRYANRQVLAALWNLNSGEVFLILDETQDPAGGGAASTCSGGQAATLASPETRDQAHNKIKFS